MVNEMGFPWLAHSLSLQPAHRPDMTEILLKKDVKLSFIHPARFLDLGYGNQELI